MILESLCRLARHEGLLANPDYEPKAVAWIIVLDEGGRLINVEPTAGADDGKKAKGKIIQIPRRNGRTSAAIADFAVDKSEYVLGVEPDGTRPTKDLEIRAGLFRQCIEGAASATGSSALTAVSSFLSSHQDRLRAIERISAHGYKSNDLFAFEYKSSLVHELPEVQQYFSQVRRAAAKTTGSQCLICGNIAAPVEKHPAVKIPGGTTSGIALVSFNSDAFESYGLQRNQNAPVCRDCADAYTTALNRLLSEHYPDPRHPGEILPRRYVRLSWDTTAVFWADADSAALDVFANLFDSPSVESVTALLQAPYKGQTPAASDPRFYCLILSGAQGRAVVRSTHTGTVSRVEQNLRKYFDAIDIDSERPLPLLQVLRGLVLQGKLENLPPELTTDVFIAILFDQPFPRTLIASAVSRCRAERRVTRERAALLRAYLNRNQSMEVSVALDKSNTRPGYRLGRLMAVLERVQAQAQNNPNKTIVDRYYGAASTRPATVFPSLMATAQHHIAKLPEGSQISLQKRLAEVIDGLETFPAVLNMEEQGLFALGYYHQRQDFFKKADTNEANQPNEASEKGEAA